MDEEILVKIEMDDWCFQSNAISFDKQSLNNNETAVEKVMDNIESLVKSEENEICFSSDESVKNQCGITSLGEIKREPDEILSMNKKLLNIHVYPPSSNSSNECARPTIRESKIVVEKMIFNEARAMINLGEDENSNNFNEASNQCDELITWDNLATKGRFRCEDCEISFSDKKIFTNHLFHCQKKKYEILKTDTEAKQFGNPCKYGNCGKSFEMERTLQIHIETHIETQKSASRNKLRASEKLYKCEICMKEFYRVCHLERHVRVHTGEKPYNCNVCEKRFSQRSHLKSHLAIHTGERPYKCDICGKTFSLKQNLRLHYRTHTGEKPYHCDICGKTFSQDENLQHHLRTHTAKKQYECDVCGKRFSRKNNLQRHLRVHTGEKPYSCDICGKTFSQKSHVEIHLRTHTGEKPYECDDCGKGFAIKDNLRKHLATHTGKKPHNCDIGRTTFATTSS